MEPALGSDGIQSPPNGPKMKDVASNYQVGMKSFRYVVHVDVHVDELLQVKVHFALRETEHAVADVRLDARLFGIEQVHDGVGYVEQFRLEQAQQPRLLAAFRVHRNGSTDGHLIASGACTALRFIAVGSKKDQLSIPQDQLLGEQRFEVLG